ncbi:Glutaredoxin-C10 [Raphanus sativus]|uniref:Glutaredoxin-C10-like n=1 Tax=Raphanus sativus TaxID=3726 RepID=A0A6J0K8Q8_RAPSA|nr:glutaredoxin-C10-like [Raphanus sativus]KAJ4882990.1 Glutaredoxin-C10 [Raphanus sativus]
MQGLRNFTNDDVSLDLMVPPTVPAPVSSATTSTSLSFDEEETSESKIERLISEHPVIIFTRSSSCCMCHVMKKLLLTVGVHPTVIEADEEEISCLAVKTAPVLFIGGACVGGFESLVALHLSGHLVSRLVEVGALWA